MAPVARRMHDGKTSGNAANVAAAALAESTRRDTRIRWLQRIIRHCGCSLEVH